ncbi:helix-turn-helix domain-containing protein [Acetobacteraceae bacterium KSS8]|uniref:Helix-turn-helix domain-containing protein n=1 Tax=Endosaccharibacter trunci TaxID=2812733 RepID=A0ABT1WAR8_9PROT|nr:helix-turn-helix domain-containing protein [Acetobacteraceae bacterium KSS8]
MTDALALMTEPAGQGSCMLTGHQIAAARRLAGFGSQRSLAEASGVSEPTIARAEAAKGEFPKMEVPLMAKLVKALEVAGVEFTLDAGRTLAGGVSFRRRG